MKNLLAILLMLGTTCLLAESQEGLQNGLRGSTPLNKEASPPAIPKVVNDDLRKERAFAMQPPVIPHQIENYQIDRNFNKCMSCHGRGQIAESQAPMVSVTHFSDRDGNVLAEISPRRYFCTQCHIPQMEVNAPVANVFGDTLKVPAPGPGKRK